MGGERGFMGSDGVNPIDCLILVGHGNRMWLEPHYFDPGIKPIGKLRVIVPGRPDLPEEDLVLDAVPAFAPACFGDRCPSLAAVAAALKDAESLDFDLAPEKVPAKWAALREEACPLLREIGIRRGDLAPVVFAGSACAGHQVDPAPITKPGLVRGLAMPAWLTAGMPVCGILGAAKCDSYPREPGRFAGCQGTGLM